KVAETSASASRGHEARRATLAERGDGRRRRRGVGARAHGTRRPRRRPPRDRSPATALPAWGARRRGRPPSLGSSPSGTPTGQGQRVEKTVQDARNRAPPRRGPSDILRDRRSRTPKGVLARRDGAHRELATRPTDAYRR